MAVPTGTTQTYTMIGIREDLADSINLLNAYTTPFYSKIGSDTAKNRTPEWLAHAAPAANPANAVIEGDTPTNQVASQPIRYKNIVQLMDKAYQVSSTAMAVDRAGQKEMLRLALINGIALRTDIEAALTQNSASVLGAAGVAGRLASAESWIATNINLGATGASTGFNTGTGLVAAPTDGTQRAATEVILKDVIRQCYISGGDNLDVLVGPAQKQNFSGFTGRSTQYQNVVGNSTATILGAADVYISDFGSHKIYPTRFNRNRTALVLDWSLWQKSFLQPIQDVDLAKTGHNLQKMMFCEVTLKCMNEKGNGKAADLT